jgi:hypothetical protein
MCTSILVAFGCRICRDATKIATNATRIATAETPTLGGFRGFVAIVAIVAKQPENHQYGCPMLGMRHVRSVVAPLRIPDRVSTHPGRTRRAF